LGKKECALRGARGEAKLNGRKEGWEEVADEM
jgi:hypothetical protein